MIPENLRYTAEHEWVGAVAGADALRVGITDFAQDSLGDIVFVDLPDVGSTIEAGQPFGEVESTKSVSELYAPVTGTVVARNDQLNEEPELVNTDPYGSGWLIELAPASAEDLDELLDAAAYGALTEQS
ncbi:glycine cleavage system protein GcvH [Luedemannella flava]|uniref:Glycine cleavage system H protein n=1 Tax=Luedemannella flava TaxID=349316 RepID=A0ABN2MMW6_9ACTN